MRTYQNLTSKLQSILKDIRIEALMVRGMSASFVITIIGTALKMVEQLFLTRTLGIVVYGQYAYVQSWEGLLIIFAAFGLTTSSYRFVGQYYGAQKWSLLRGFFQYSHRSAFRISSLIATLTIIIVLILSSWVAADLVIAFLIACLAIPLDTLSLILGAEILGLKHLIVSEVLDHILRPLLFISGLILCLIVLGFPAHASVAMLLYLLVSFTLTITMWSYEKRILPEQVRKAVPEREDAYWTTTSQRFLILSALRVFMGRIGIIFLGLFLGTTPVGIFALASSIVALVDFGLAAVNTVLNPRIADLYFQSRIADLQRVVRLGAFVSFAYGCVVTGFLILLGRPILGLFGPEFVEGYIPLVIMLLGKLFNSFAGSSGSIMSMTGHESHQTRILVFSAISSVLLCLLLIPSFGMVGAAIAVTVTTVIANLMIVIFTRVKIGINATILTF